ncbi:short-chain dehydrogenase [Armillaria borealis]|uniref:Short-chain dehydrogenase n=1 Tax=Armillaria borealis TaxID=47425 RepID=A0AA39JCP4_9AGAR|nr:short-chain dehydrogenase [Armillaria borealis]
MDTVQRSPTIADLNLAVVMSLSGRVALVTGGGIGIRFNIAKTFAANGAKVYITGRRLDVLEKAAASVTGVPGSVIPLQMDVTELSRSAPSTLRTSMDTSISSLTLLDSPDAFHNPDFFAKKLAATDPFEPESIQNWADIFALNTIGPFFVVRRAFQSLLTKGTGSRPQGASSVINVSTVVAKLNPRKPGVMSKAALAKLTLVLGSSFAGRGIPIRKTGSKYLETLKTKAPPGFVAPIPARRHGTDAEMRMSVVYLAVSDYTNGAVLSLDGCASLVNP